MAGLLIGWAASCSHDTGTLGGSNGGTGGVASGAGGLSNGAGGAAAGTSGIAGGAGGAAGSTGAIGGAGATIGSGGTAGGGAGIAGVPGTGGAGGLAGGLGTGGAAGARGGAGAGGTTGSGGTAGAPACTTGTRCADGVCSSNIDSSHCGIGCAVCTGGSTCVGGACTCGSSQLMYCNGSCVDITGTLNCGTCGNKCTAGQLCSGGHCVGGGSGGSSGSGGAGGAANCVDAVKKNGYAYSGAQPCSACVDNSVNRSAVCQAVIDCLEVQYPCSGNCEINCQNNAGATTVVMSCVDALVVASCGSGSTGTGGTSGGTGGTGGGTGPCAGLCSNPTAAPPDMNVGNLGTGATCQEVAGGSITKVICGNFVAPRTFTVNGTPIDCVNSAITTLPATRNGGYCMQASAGQYSYAYFSTF